MKEGGRIRERVKGRRDGIENEGVCRDVKRVRWRKKIQEREGGYRGVRRSDSRNEINKRSVENAAAWQSLVEGREVWREWWILSKQWLFSPCPVPLFYTDIYCITSDPFPYAFSRHFMPGLQQLIKPLHFHWSCRASTVDRDLTLILVMQGVPSEVLTVQHGPLRCCLCLYRQGEKVMRGRIISWVDSSTNK